MEIITRHKVDDIIAKDTGEHVKATETIDFGMDGQWYKIDLCDKNAVRLRAMAEEFKPYATKIEEGVQRRHPKPTRDKPAGNGLDKIQSLAVRNWAQRNGHEVANRGPIPADVLDAFERAGGISIISDSAP